MKPDRYDAMNAWWDAHASAHFALNGREVPMKTCVAGCCGACGVPNPFSDGVGHGAMPQALRSELIRNPALTVTGWTP